MNTKILTIDQGTTSSRAVIFGENMQVIDQSQQEYPLIYPADGWVEIDPNVTAHAQHAYMPMIETADLVAEKYSVSRESQDEYSLQSQLRTAAAQESDLYKDEIISTKTIKLVKDKETGEVSEQEVTLEKDEGNRPETNIEGLSSLVPVYGEDKYITAGNASQLSDGSASVLSLIHI